MDHQSFLFAGAMKLKMKKSHFGVPYDATQPEGCSLKVYDDVVAIGTSWFSPKNWLVFA